MDKVLKDYSAWKKEMTELKTRSEIQGRQIGRLINRGYKKDKEIAELKQDKRLLEGVIDRSRKK